MGDSIDKLFERATRKTLEGIIERTNDPDTPAHVLARDAASLAAFKKLDQSRSREEPEAVTALAPAIDALPPKHARELLTAEIARLEAVIEEYRILLEPLVEEAVPA